MFYDNYVYNKKMHLNNVFCNHEKIFLYAFMTLKCYSNTFYGNSSSTYSRLKKLRKEKGKKDFKKSTLFLPSFLASRNKA